MNVLDAKRRRRRNLGIAAGVVVVAAIAAVQVAQAVIRPRPAPWVEQLADLHYLERSRPRSKADRPRADCSRTTFGLSCSYGEGLGTFETTSEVNGRGHYAISLTNARHVEALDFGPKGGVKLITKERGRGGSEEQWFVIHAGPLAKDILMARTRAGQSEPDEFFVFRQGYTCSEFRPEGIDGAPEAVCTAAAKLLR